jgi:hypothetical protein
MTRGASDVVICFLAENAEGAESSSQNLILSL